MVLAGSKPGGGGGGHRTGGPYGLTGLLPEPHQDWAGPLVQSKGGMEVEFTLDKGKDKCSRQHLSGSTRITRWMPPVLKITMESTGLGDEC